jgi:hypothetical protein
MRHWPSKRAIKSFCWDEWEFIVRPAPIRHWDLRQNGSFDEMVKDFTCLLKYEDGISRSFASITKWLPKSVRLFCTFSTLRPTRLLSPVTQLSLKNLKITLFEKILASFLNWGRALSKVETRFLIATKLRSLETTITLQQPHFLVFRYWLTQRSPWLLSNPFSSVVSRFWLNFNWTVHRCFATPYTEFVLLIRGVLT